MTPRLRLRLGAAVVAATLLPLAACTPGGDGPSTSPTPTLQPSPPETSLERQQRLDFEAAAKSYRAFMEEYNRLAKAGGSLQATPVMKSTAAGPFLAFYTDALREQKQQGQRYTTGVEIGYVKSGAYSSNELTLEVCEDGSQNKVLDRDGKEVAAGQILLRAVYVRPIQGRWTLWNGDERDTVQSCTS
ncbi:MAG TPA: hypothetical protein VFP34_19210 [Microlunatus sp.]|nr:hypothetical protein [Microlunatus sp.]